MDVLAPAVDPAILGVAVPAIAKDHARVRAALDALGDHSLAASGLVLPADPERRADGGQELVGDDELDVAHSWSMWAL